MCIYSYSVKRQHDIYITDHYGTKLTGTVDAAVNDVCFTESPKC